MIGLDIERLKQKVATYANNYQKYKRVLLILEHYNYECVVCHTKENLTIDHIDGYRNYGKNRRMKLSNYTIEDCQVLCVECHKQKNVKEGIRKYKDVYENEAISEAIRKITKRLDGNI